MILQGKVYLKTAKRYKKVHEVHQSNDNNFLLLVQNDHRQDVIVHVSDRGKINFQYPFPNPITSIAMISPKIVIALGTRDDSLIVIHLKQQRYKRVPYMFMFEACDRSNIITFTNSKILAIEQKGPYNDSRYKLCYYNFEDFQQIFTSHKNGTATNGKTNQHHTVKIKPFWTYESQEDEWTWDQTTFKANNDSMIVWFNGLVSQYIRFSTYSLDSNKKGTLNTHHIKLQKIEAALGYIPKIEIKNCKEVKVKLEIGLLFVWEKEDGIFWIVTLSNCQTERQDPTKKILIYDSKLTRLKEIKLDLRKMQDQIIDCIMIGNKTLLVTYEEQKERVSSSHLLFIDNVSEGIIGSDIWQYNNHTHIQPSYYDSFSLIQASHAMLDVERLDLKIQKIVRPRQIYVHMMFEMYPDFEDGLISQVLTCLKNCD